MHKRELIWTWVIVGILLIGLFTYQIVTISRLNAQIAQMEQDFSVKYTALEDRAGLLEGQVEDVGVRLDETAAVLEERIAGVEDDVSRRINILGTQLSAVETQSAQLQEQLLDLNLKTQDFSLIVEDVVRSVVSIKTDKSSGSGTIVRRDGYVVTNAHVIAGASAAQASTSDGRTYAVRLIATNEDLDLALLELITDRTFSALTFEDSRNVRVGTKVIALGNPIGLEFTVTEGIVSAVGRTDSDGIPVVQTDVPINPGNSGGPLVNIEGRIVGINTYKARGFEGLGFAIESDTVDDFVDSAIAAWEAQMG